ncbi:MAG TPA: hypothetical protein PLR54_09945 [Spirochaetota bacterium]|nr:hypothetical protein [Spirochaetota bacterium]
MQLSQALHSPAIFIFHIFHLALCTHLQFPYPFFERRPGVRLSPVTIALDIITVTNDNNYKIV